VGHYVYIKNKKRTSEDLGHWDNKKKIETVTTYLATGSPTLTASLTGVPQQTIFRWRKEPWWQEMVQQLHDDDNLVLDSKVSKIISKTLGVIEDRLDNGNAQLDQKTGKIIRVPVTMGETHRVLSDLVSQRRIIRKEPTQITQKQEGINDRLVKLAEQFASFAMKGEKPSSEDIVEAEFTEVDEDALHDQRPEGLQEGEQAVQLLGEAEEKQSRPEQGTSNDD
jgi:hypothetical protein